MNDTDKRAVLDEFIKALNHQEQNNLNRKGSLPYSEELIKQCLLWAMKNEARHREFYLGLYLSLSGFVDEIDKKKRFGQYFKKGGDTDALISGEGKILFKEFVEQVEYEGDVVRRRAEKYLALLRELAEEDEILPDSVVLIENYVSEIRRRAKVQGCTG